MSQTCCSCSSPVTAVDIRRQKAALIGSGMEVALLTGGFDQPYAFGLAMELAARGVCLDVVGSDAVDGPEMHQIPGLNFLNLQGSWSNCDIVTKLARVFVFYCRLLRYTATTRSRVFHILWNNKLQLFDRTALMLFYRMIGKKIVLTAHNVNAGKRDLNDSLLNRLSLKVQYRLAHHIFVHTELMKREIQREFGLEEKAVSVIPFGINNAVPHTDLSPAEARECLGIENAEKTLLFFGAIRPYKGLEYLVDAFLKIAPMHPDYRLIIAGEPRKGHEKYWDDIQRRIDSDANAEMIIRKIEYIPDNDTEVYFKAADLVVLPYTHVFQSGVLFLAHSFGVPVVATDVGSLREDIIEDKTGYLCRPSDGDDLARVIANYFGGYLFRTLNQRRKEIRQYAESHHSWSTVGEKTCEVYSGLLGGSRS